MSVIRQLAAMYASMDWNPQKYRVIRYYRDDEIINGYACYRIQDYGNNAAYESNGIGGHGVKIFEIEIDVISGKTYSISGDFMAGNHDRADTVRFVTKGPDGVVASKAVVGNTQYFGDKRTLTLKYTATMDGALRLQLQYYASGKYCYLIKDSIKVTEA